MTWGRLQSRLFIIVCAVGFASPTHALVNLTWRPVSQVVVAGGIAVLELDAYADNPIGHVISALDVIVQHDISRTQLLSIDSSVATYPWLVDGLFSGAPDNVNLDTTDGTVLYTAFAYLGFQHPVPSTGIVLANFHFKVLPVIGVTTVDMVDHLGTLAETRVFDGTVPNYDILGTIQSATLKVIPVPVLAPSIGAAKQHPDGTSVQVNRPVTRSFANEGFFYLEDPNRAAGIRINCDIGLEPPEGSSQIVTGILATIDNERVMQDTIIVDAGPSAIPAPLGMKIDSGTAPPGLSPAGLYVRLTGKAEVSAPLDPTFVLNDGGVSPIRVEMHNAIAPPDGTFVEVTGVLGADSSGPVIRVNRQLDIRPLTP